MAEVAWVQNVPLVSSPRFFPTLMGAFGVAMGFAAFVLVREQAQAPAASPITFLLGLLAASVTSYAIESVRERAEGHTPGGAVEPGRVLGLIVLLAVFELYVSGAEEVVKLVAGGDPSAFVSALFVSGITAGLGVVPQLILFAGLWVALGAAAAWSMMPDERAAKPAEAHTPTAASLFAAATWRIARGLLLVAGIALAYVIVARLLLIIWVLLTRPEDYAPAFDTLLSDSTGQAGNPFARAAILLASSLEGLAHLGRWGGALLLVVTAGLTAIVARSLRARKGTSMFVRILALTVILCILGPFVTSPTQFSRLVRIVSATTLTWIAPLVVLAVATPHLRAHSRSPRVWGIVAFAVAVVLVLVTWDRLSEPPVPMFVAAFVLALVVTGWLFWRGADVLKFWPLVALTIAIAAFEGSSVLQRLSFLTTFKEAALLQSAPLTGGVELRARRGFLAVQEWEKDGSVDMSTAAAVAAVGALADGATDHQLTLVEQRTSAALAREFAAAVDPLCRPSGLALLDTLHRDIAAWCLAVRTIGAAPRDSAQAFWLALSNAPEPWRGGLTALLAGADEESRREVFAFRWQSPETTRSQSTVASASRKLSSADLDREPAQLVSLAMRQSAVTPTTRLWMLMHAFARSTPPIDQLDGWVSDWGRREIAEASRSDGLMLQSVLSLWSVRVRQLANLVEARYLAGAPADAPHTGLVLPARRVDRFERETRTVIALHFATEQLRARRQEREGSNALHPDVGAAMLLELSLGASFAFWSTAGLLAGLSRRDP